MEDLLSKVERQCLENSNASDEIQTHQTGISNTEIFDYRKSLQFKIGELKKEIKSEEQTRESELEITLSDIKNFIKSTYGS